MARITKRENLVAIAEVLTNAGNVELAEFVNKEIATLDKRAAAPRKMTKEQRINEDIKLNILGSLGEAGPQTATDVANSEGISVQKASQLLRQLREVGLVTRTEAHGNVKTMFANVA